MATVRFALLALSLLCCAKASALSVPPRPASGVADPDAVLTPPARAQIERLLATYAQGTTVRYGVAMFRSLAAESLEDFSMKIAESWKIGSKQHSDGVLLVVSVEDRKIRIEVGYGLEDKLTDAICGRIIREQMAPQFRAGSFVAGVSAALAEIDRHATGRPAIAAAPPTRLSDVGAPGAAASQPYVPPGTLVPDETAQGDFDFSDYLVIGVFAAAIIGLGLWAFSGSRGGTDGLLDGGASSFRSATGMTLSAGGTTGSASPARDSSSSSWDTSSSRGGRFGGGGASGEW